MVTRSPFVLLPRELPRCLLLVIFSLLPLFFFLISPVWQAIQSEHACTWHMGKPSQPAMKSSSCSAVVPALLAGASTPALINYTPES